MFMSESGDVCENAVGETFDFDLNATILDGDGRFVPLLTPDGTYYDIATGVVDPAGLAVGTYVVSTRYFYNNDQCDRQGPTFTLTVDPAPVVDFILSPLEVCIGEPVAIDDSMVGNVASFTYNGGVRNANDNIRWMTPGTKTVKVVVETTAGCIDSSEQTVIVQDSLILGPILCEESGLDYAIFNWADVPNAEDYTVSYIIDGAPAEVEVVTESMIEFTGLGTGVIVQITVTANPSAGFCPTVSRLGVCETSNCPDIEVSFNTGPFCYGAGSNPIDLELVITDPLTGDPITDGTVEWLDMRVVDGIFTPGTSANNQDYNLAFIFTDRDGCETRRTLMVDVISEPNPTIAPIDGFCVDGNGVVELMGNFNNGEDILWEWEGGSATGAGPHDISFATGNMQYEVTVTVTNGTDGNGDICVGTATATVLVDPELTAPVFIDCNANNTGVTFEWGPVSNADEYEILVDGVSVGTQDGTTYMIPATPGESFMIEVIAISGNNCSNVSSTDECTATDCAPATFVNIDDIEM
jgi:large repetitive protein